MKLQLLQAKLLDEGTKVMIKAGYLSEDLSLTEKGKRILDTLLFLENKEAMVEQAEKLLSISEKKEENENEVD
jgi:hypothetical protein